MTLEEFRNKMRPLSHYAKRELINAAWEEATKAEREACAKECEEQGEKWLSGEAPNQGHTVSDFLACATAIRARSNK